MSRIKRILEKVEDCLKRPCTMCVIENAEENPQSFEIIYRNIILGHVNYVPVVGDYIFGKTVWEVDYLHRYAYVDD